jgi:hypothetical protein
MITDGDLIVGAGSDGKHVNGGPGIVTTVGNPGSDVELPTEQAVREAFQPLDATLTTIAGLTTAAGKILYFTAADTAGLLDLVTSVADPGTDTQVATAKAVRTALNAKVDKATFDANTILKADADDTPAALTVGEQTLVGRITSGVITALTPAQVRTLIDVYTKGETDAKISLAITGLDPQDSVKDRYDPTGGLPGTPSSGDRYIATATANGWTIHHIYEYNGATWDDITPNEGFWLWVEDEDMYYAFNGTSWVSMPSITTHANLSGLQGGTTAQYYHLTSAQHANLIIVGNLTPAANSVVVYSAADAASMVTVAEQYIVGRKTGGTLTGLTAAEIITLLALDSRYVLPVGAADIEITDAAKGLILRTGDAHRARITLSGTTPTYNVQVADLGAA